jgi:hypothetical protein
MAAKGIDIGSMLTQLATNALGQALSSVKGDAMKNVMAALNDAREGSLRLLLVFKTPDGKMEHVRILMSPEEAMAACKSVFRSLKEEQESSSGSGFASGQKGRGGGVGP